MSRVQSMKQPKCEDGHSAPTVRDIASLARVSTATVSRVLNGRSDVTPEKRRSVKEAIQQTGFKPNEAATRMAGLSALKRRSKQGA
jgi:DNA-binding LacI/PurR family transcriptional regulator